MVPSEYCAKLAMTREWHTTGYCATLRLGIGLAQYYAVADSLTLASCVSNLHTQKTWHSTHLWHSRPWQSYMGATLEASSGSPPPGTILSR